MSVYPIPAVTLKNMFALRADALAVSSCLALLIVNGFWFEHIQTPVEIECKIAPNSCCHLLWGLTTLLLHSVDAHSAATRTLPAGRSFSRRSR